MRRFFVQWRPLCIFRASWQSFCLLHYFHSSQQVTGFLPRPSWDEAQELLLACRADVAGFGAVASHHDDVCLENSRKRGCRSFLMVLPKVFVENSCRLRWHSSYCGIMFDQLSPHARAKLLFSMVFGAVSALYKCVRLNLSVPDHFKVVTLLVSFLFLFVIACCVVKLFSLHECESHMFNLSSWSCLDGLGKGSSTL